MDIVQVQKIVTTKGPNARILPNGETVLFKAVKEGDIKAVRYILNRGGNPNILNDTGCSPLCYAKKVEIIRYLAKKGANPTIPSVWKHIRNNDQILEIFINKHQELRKLFLGELFPLFENVKISRGLLALLNNEMFRPILEQHLKHRDTVNAFNEFLIRYDSSYVNIVVNLVDVLKIVEQGRTLEEMEKLIAQRYGLNSINFPKHSAVISWFLSHKEKDNRRLAHYFNIYVRGKWKKERYQNLYGTPWNEWKKDISKQLIPDKYDKEKLKRLFHEGIIKSWIIEETSQSIIANRVKKLYKLNERDSILLAYLSLDYLKTKDNETLKELSQRFPHIFPNNVQYDEIYFTFTDNPVDLFTLGKSVHMVTCQSYEAKGQLTRGLLGNLEYPWIKLMAIKDKNGEILGRSKVFLGKENGEWVVIVDKYFGVKKYRGFLILEAQKLLEQWKNRGIISNYYIEPLDRKKIEFPTKSDVPIYTSVPINRVGLISVR